MPILYNEDFPILADVLGWKEYFRLKVNSLDPSLRDQAVAFLRDYLSPNMEFLRGEIAKNPNSWSSDHHFWGMMSVRNVLRQNGFGERELHIDNLDDYAVGLVELAAQEKE